MKKLFIPCLVVLIAACSGDGDATDTDSLDVDSVLVTVEDTATADEDTISYEPPEVQEKNELKELSKDKFCECVKQQEEFNQRVNKALEKEGPEADAALDKALEDMDEFDKGECKNMLAGNTDSPDKRAEHQRKVKKCLRK